ncbi:hypothetical protein FOG18_13010 [Legionella israelensis]|uniref:hypothetical protein n=1 Tax=Legionella israelensis TaxID=454 RepID=UPI00117CFBFA|nr:hypothetical protein [Legionella israelensis]QDP73416.1 hypothetical protein FOG18_13010 [Legionella israelensis]
MTRTRTKGNSKTLREQIHQFIIQLKNTLEGEKALELLEDYLSHKLVPSHSDTITQKRDRFTYFLNQLPKGEAFCQNFNGINAEVQATLNPSGKPAKGRKLAGTKLNADFEALLREWTIFLQKEHSSKEQFFDALRKLESLSKPKAPRKSNSVRIHNKRPPFFSSKKSSDSLLSTTETESTFKEDEEKNQDKPLQTSRTSFTIHETEEKTKDVSDSQVAVSFANLSNASLKPTPATDLLRALQQHIKAQNWDITGFGGTVVDFYHDKQAKKAQKPSKTNVVPRFVKKQLDAIESFMKAVNYTPNFDEPEYTEKMALKAVVQAFIHIPQEARESKSPVARISRFFTRKESTKRYYDSFCNESVNTLIEKLQLENNEKASQLLKDVFNEPQKYQSDTPIQLNS